MACDTAVAARHRRPARRSESVSVRPWGAALLLVVVATGCSATAADPDASSRGPASAPEITKNVPVPGEEARKIVVPFDAYNISPAEGMTIDLAEDSLIGDCMRGQGMKWPALPRPAERDIEPPNRRSYGVVEPDAARVFGYHVPQDRPSVARMRAALRARTKQLSPEERRAAYGDESTHGPGGCQKKARRKMMKGAPEIDVSLFNKRIFDAFDRSQRDEKVKRAFRAWSGCMAKTGFRYKDPLAAVTDERWGTRKPSRTEIRAARADVWCKEETGLTEIWMAAEKRIQDDCIRRHPEDFRTLKTNKDVQLKAARRILAERG
ncbi:hypothetical protein AB0H03_32800 [Streptomyces sparsogenes]|uniref:hypothetical protein n=1 Tax=Streptomyces sparsogenes TaxID=67365 RepID=UPI0033FD65AF